MWRKYVLAKLAAQPGIIAQVHQKTLSLDLIQIRRIVLSLIY